MRRRTSFWTKIIFFSGLVIILLIAGAVYGLRQLYEQNLRPVSDSSQSVEVTIPTGATPAEIASTLSEKSLIREAWAFEWFVRNENLREFLKAGTYELSPNMSVKEIASIITEGRVASDLVTILPGKRIDEIADYLIETFDFSASEVNTALNPSLYANHPALVDKPRSASLEGYLFPESFLRNSDTDAQEIIKLSLDEMQNVLTPEVRKGIAKQNLTVHEGIILASIIDSEVPEPKDQKKVAQVFLKRLKQNILLESDATTSYGRSPSNKFGPEAYNTYKKPGLTPTPISNVTASSLKAVASPAKTNFLYFVSGDDGTTHFSFTLEKHQENTRKYCTKLCN